MQRRYPDSHKAKRLFMERGPDWLSGGRMREAGEGRLDPTILVFLVGTAAGILPMYWLIDRVATTLKRRTKTSRQSLRSVAHSQEFMELLRREAAARAANAVAQAARELRSGAGNGSHARLRTSLKHELIQVRQLVREIWSIEPTAETLAAIDLLTDDRVHASELLEHAAQKAIAGLRALTASCDPATA